MHENANNISTVYPRSTRRWLDSNLAVERMAITNVQKQRERKRDAYRHTQAHTSTHKHGSAPGIAGAAVNAADADVAAPPSKRLPLHITPHPLVLEVTNDRAEPPRPPTSPRKQPPPQRGTPDAVASVGNGLEHCRRRTELPQPALGVNLPSIKEKVVSGGGERCGESMFRRGRWWMVGGERWVLVADSCADRHACPLTIRARISPHTHEHTVMP